MESRMEDSKTKGKRGEEGVLSMLEKLASMMKLEFLNPLNDVRRLVSDSSRYIEEGNPARKSLGEAEERLQHLASLVDSLIGLSAKRNSFDREPAPLNTVIENAAFVARARNASSNISLRLKLSPNVPNVNTNDLYQIIISLLSNAFDAITTGIGSVSVETRLDDKDFHIIVEDNGRGIPKRIQPHLFTALHSAKKECGKGIGLGLAIVKKIVDGYDGTIQVESEETVGTKMHLTFPLSKLIRPVQSGKDS